MSAIKYLSKINNKSFADCVSFIQQQSQALGVDVSSSHDLGTILHKWASYLSTESALSANILNDAEKLLNSQNPHKTFNQISKLHSQLVERKSLLSFMQSDSEIVQKIKSHPFYESFQKETLEQGFHYVEDNYRAFKEIDERVKKVSVQLDRIKNKVLSLPEPSLGLDDLYLPDSNDILGITKGLDETKKLLDLKPQLFYTGGSTANLANASAMELALLWKQAHTVLDLTMSRWLSIAYFGLLLNAVVKHEIMGQSLSHLIAAQNEEMKEFGRLINSIT